MSFPFRDETADQYNNQEMPKLQLRHTPYGSKFNTTDQALFDSKDIATHSQAFDIVSPCNGTGDAMLQMQNPPLLAFRNKTNIQKVGVVTPNITSPKNIINNNNRGNLSTSYAQSSLLQRRPLTALKDPEILSIDVVKKQIEQEKMTIDFKEDPVAYFSKRKDGRGHRFIYLIYRGDPHDPLFSPYDLIKVPFAEIKGDYFTMSATGVTHVYDDGTTETMSLDLWAQEKSIFNSIRKLKIFAQFFYWKPFRIWKNFVMHQRYNELDSVILYHPFFKNKEFFSLALFIYSNQSKSKDLLQKFLLAFQSQRKFKLEDFIQTNKSNIEHLKAKYDKFINKTMLEVQSLYTTISDPKLVQVHDSDFPDIKRRNPNLAQLMVLEKRKATKRMAKTEAVNRQIMEIGAFVRLIDYMLLESLSEGCHESWKNAESSVSSDRSSVFVIDVLYDDEGKVAFAPTLNVLIESIETVLHESLKTLSLLPRLLMQLPLKPFLRDNGLDYIKLFDEGPQFAQVIDRKLLEKAKQHIIEVVKTSYHECFEVSQSFSSFYPIYRMGQVWNVSDYLITSNGKKFIGTLNYDLSVEVINDDFLLNPDEQPIVDFQRVTNDINKFIEDKKRVENMRNGAARGALFIDSKGLKAILTPILDKSLNDLRELLEKLSSLKIDKLRCALQYYSRKLKQEPQTLDDYVTFCELIERCQKTTPQIEKEIEFIDKLFELFDKFEFNHDENPNHSLFVVFTNDKNAALSTKADQLGIFTEAIKGLIAEIDQKISKYFEKATTIPSTLKNIDIDLCLQDSKKLCVKIDGLKPRVTEVIRQQKIIEVSFNNFERYDSLILTANFAVKLYEAVNQWLELSVTMNKIAFKAINVEQFKKDILSLKDKAEKLKEESPKETEYPLLDELLNKINEIAPYVDQLDKLSHGKMQLRHWNLLFQSCNHKGDYHENITIEELSRYKILPEKDKIDAITATSQGESELEAEFASIMNHWDTVQMPLAETQIKSEETLLLGPTDPLLIEIQDALITLSKMASLPYVQGIKDDVSKLSTTLEKLSLIIETWQLFQGNWIVLSALFSNTESKNILPNQTNDFSGVQKKWSLIARHTLKDTRLLHACNYPNLYEMLKESNKTMESILASLGKYLDVKRQSSPRLFFLGNSEVLTLVTTSNASNLTSILTKVFMHVAKIDCHENDGAEGEAAFKGNNFQRLKIFGLIGEDGDCIQFQRHINFNPSFEVLINQIIESMKTTVKDGISAAIPGCQSGSFVDWIMTTPTYIAFIALNIVFCNEMEDCFATYESNPRAFQQYEGILKRRIEDSMDSYLMPLSPRDKYKLNAILTELLGFRDRFRAATEKIQNHSPYLEWLNSLRFRYLPNSTSIQVEFSDQKVDHGYEYWGKTPILIHTPSIDACLSDCVYLLNQNQIPLITGSASSAKQVIGKTLACLFGQFAYIIRPFPDMSEYLLSKILTGVVSAGALAIFSGIEQLSENCLSFLFDNIHSIISSNEAGVSRITISNRLSDLNKNCRFLLTADSNFASFGNIPPQLKVCARPISLLSPSYSKIIEIYMTAVGFRETKTIVPKFSSFIQSIHSIFSPFLSNISLSSRILKICSKAKEMTKLAEKTAIPEELSVVYNSFNFFAPLCDPSHVELLKNILFNSFQVGSNVEGMISKLNKIKNDIIESNLIESIEKEISELNLEVDSNYLTNQCLSLYNLLKQHHCVIIVGPPNSGKSTILDVLKNVLNRLEEVKVNVLTLFHLSEKWSRIYGEVYDDSNIGTIYSYGEIQSAIYKTIENSTDCHQILKLDGKVTKKFSCFISEFLGSSQSEKLMLNSLDTFLYSPNFHIVIETDNLKNATPSLLAKSGILYMRNLQVETPYNQISPPCVLTNPSIPFARALKKVQIDQEDAKLVRTVFCTVAPAIVSKMNHLDNIVSNDLDNGNVLLGEVLPMYAAVLAMTSLEQSGIKKDDEDQVRLVVIISFCRIYMSVLIPSQVIPFTSWLCTEYHIELPKDWVGYTVSPTFSEFFDRPQLFSVRLNQGEIIPLSSSDLEKPPVFSNPINNEKRLPILVDELNVIHPQILPILHITKLLLMSHQNMIIHGPIDSGKSSFLPILFSEKDNIEPIIIDCSCYLTGESIMDYLCDHTNLVAKSRNRSPSESLNYVLVFDGVESTHIELMEFIRMIITTHKIPRYSPNDHKVFEFSTLLHFSVIVTTRCYNELPTRFLSHFAPVVMSSITETNASFIGGKILQTYGISKELSENLMKASIMTITQFPYGSIIHNIISICSSLCFLDKNPVITNETTITNALLSELFYSCLHKYQVQEYKEKVPTVFEEYFKGQVQNTKAFLLLDPFIYPSFESTEETIKAEVKPHTIQSLQEELNYYLTVHNTNSIEKISIKFTKVTIREWFLLYQALSRPGKNALLYGKDGSGRYIFSRFVSHQLENDFICFHNPTPDELLCEKNRIEMITNSLKEAISKAVFEKKKSVIYIKATNENEKEVRFICDFATKLSIQPLFTETELIELYVKADKNSTKTVLTWVEKRQIRLSIINILRYHLHFLINVSSDLNYKLDYNRFDSIQFDSDNQENYDSAVSVMLKSDEMKEIINNEASETQMLSLLLPKMASIARKFNPSSFCTNKFYDFIDCFSHFMKRDFKEIETKNNNISSALNFFKKLEEESTKVNKDLEDLAPNLRKLQSESEALQTSYNARKEAIEVRKKKLEQESVEKKAEFEKLIQFYNEHEQERSNLTIVAEQTTKDVEKLSDNDIETIRITAADPHPALRLLLDIFCIFLELPASYEKSGQKLLMGPMFVPTITTKINSRTITPALLEDAEVYLKDPKLNEKDLETIAPALSVLYRWIISLCKLAKSIHNLIEEKNNLDEKQRQLNKFNEEMNLELPSIEQVEKTLEKESLKLVESNESRMKMEEEYKKIDQRKKSIDSIFKQINKITDKWKSESNDYKQTFSKLIGNTIIFSFYLAFCGSMKLNERKESLNEVMELLRTHGINTSYTNPIESIQDRFFADSTNNSLLNSNLNATFNLNTSLNLNSTMNDGFPSATSGSTSNSQNTFASTMTVTNTNNNNNNSNQLNSLTSSWAAFDPCQVEVRHLTTCIRTPLLLDPDGIATHLFSSTIKSRKLITVSQSVSNLEQIIQNAISDGKILILTDCNYLHPLVSSVLSLLNFVPPNKNVSLNIRIGSKLVNWDINFKLVLVSSKLHVDDIPMNLLSRVTVINSSETSLKSTESSFERQFIEFFEPELAPKIIEMKKAESLHSVQLNRSERDTLDLISDIIETQESNPEYDYLDDESIISDLIKLKNSLISQMNDKPDFSAARKQIESKIEQFKQHIQLCQMFWTVLSRDLIVVNESACFAFNLYLKQILGVISSSGIHPGILNEEQHSALRTSIINSTLQQVFNSLPINESLFFMFLASFHIRINSQKNTIDDLYMTIDHLSAEMNKSVDFTNNTIQQATKSDEDPYDLLKNSDSLSLFEGLLKFVKESLNDEYQSFIPFFQFDSVLTDNASTPAIIFCDSKRLLNPTELIHHFASPKLRHESFVVISACDDHDMIKNWKRQIQSALSRGNWVIVHYTKPSKPIASMLCDAFSQITTTPNVNANFRLIVVASTASFLPRMLLTKSKRIVIEGFPSIRNKTLYLFQHFSSQIRSTTNPRAMKILSYVCALLLSSLSFRDFLTPVGFSSFFRLSDLAFKDSIDQLRVIIDAHPNDAPLRNLRRQIDQLICASIGEVHDRRTIQAHTSQMIMQATLDDGFTIASKSQEKEIWKVPFGETPLAGFAQIIQKIPLFTSTDVLHMNARLLLNWNMSVWATEPFVKYNSKRRKREAEMSLSFDFKSAMMKIDNFVMLMPDLIAINEDELKSKASNPIGLFIIQEVERLNFIIKYLRDELKRLTFEFMRGFLSETAAELTDGKVPKSWARTTRIWNFFSANSFTSHVIERHAQLTRLLQEQSPSSFDVRLIEFPSSLIRSFILEAAIKDGHPLDSLCYQFSISLDEKSANEKCRDQRCLRLNKICLANAEYVNKTETNFYDDDGVDGELIIRKSGKSFNAVPFRQYAALIGRVIPNVPKQTNYFNVPMYLNAVTRAMDVDDDATDIQNGETKNFVWSVPLPTDVAEIEMQQNGTTLFCRMPEQFT